jgi:5-methylcytosine-specific restriction enzyme subunit McrC
LAQSVTSFTRITVREHARLTTSTAVHGADSHTISASAFQYLCNLSSSFGKAGANLVQLESSLALRVDNYVGVIETPCGTVLEILPKHVENADGAESARKLLIKMLGVVLDLPNRKVGVADIQLLRRPLTEWVMRQFLQLLDQLVKRGVRFDYHRIEDEQRYLRGSLDAARQARQPPGRQHLFQIRHDVFLPDRPENRLLRSALCRVQDCTRDPENWRLARELGSLLEDIPQSADQTKDFRAWGKDRLMAHYRPIRPWCALVLGETMPTAQKGPQRGISLLFPMERLFEEYVARRLKEQLGAGIKMTRHAASEYMCHHDGGTIFQLQPDIVLNDLDRRWVLDTKWKLIDQADRANKYGMSQADMYQLFAYGHKYMMGKGELFLVYPTWSSFIAELPVFMYSDDLRLRVVPFNLETDRIGAAGLPFLGNAARVATDLVPGGSGHRGQTT